MASRKNPENLDLLAAPNRQSALLEHLTELVDLWRGFPLGPAQDPYPSQEPSYAPRAAGEHALSETSMALLRHWFQPEPHEIRAGRGVGLFKYWPHQRRLVETVIYLREVRRLTRVEQLYALADIEVTAQRDPWPKLGGQLATGSGKTKMMSLLIAWAYLNGLLHPDNPMGFGRHVLLIAPGLFVRDRLVQDFAPDEGPSVFEADPVIPPELRRLWDLKVYSPTTCPLRLDPAQGALVITNIHQLLRTPDEPLPKLNHRGQGELLFEPDPRALEDSSTPLIQRMARSRGLLVINDEAHHVWDEPGHQTYESAQKKPGSTEEATTAMAWIHALRKLNGDPGMKSRLALQVDLSATLFEEKGGAQKAKKGAGAEPPRALFRHTVVRYDLKDAIEDHIVKRPILERVTVRKEGSDTREALIREGQPNAWEKYRNMLVPGIQRWRQVREGMRQDGDQRKPILFVLCEDKRQAREIANFLTYGSASDQELTDQPVRGYVEPETGERLFVEKDAQGVERSTVVEIHIGQKEQNNEAEWDKIRKTVNQIDREEVLVEDEAGNKVLVPNPCNVVISVMMLKEGWDVRNVKVIVPLRPCDSRTLTEQTLGRGLRKMHAPEVQEDGAVEVREEYLYVIEHPSFDGILDQLKDILTDVADGQQVPRDNNQCAISPLVDPGARAARDVVLRRFLGMRRVVANWAQRIDVKRLPPLEKKLPWQEEIPRQIIETSLKVALGGVDREGGQSFELPELPSYRDYKHVIRYAYVDPLLKELHASHFYRNEVFLIVERYLEQKTFALPRGIPLSFASMMEGEDLTIALGNLARTDVLEAVRRALGEQLRKVMMEQVPAEEAELSEELASELPGYLAAKKHLYEPLKRSVFDRVATENQDELRVARLLDEAEDVIGWIYNHRSGVGHFLEYERQGKRARYYPDFLARVRRGPVVHHLIVEVKGRLDDKDKIKAHAALALCDLLTEQTGEPWHYVLLLENKALGREDISWWENHSPPDVATLLHHLEGLPIYSAPGVSLFPAAVIRQETVPEPDQYTRYLPLHDLEEIALKGVSTPTVRGWFPVPPEPPLSRGMFVARVMEQAPGVTPGSLGVFRRIPEGIKPQALDGRRLAVVLKPSDPGGRPEVLLRRLRIEADGTSARLLKEDSTRSQPSPQQIGAIALVAELLRVVGELPPGALEPSPAQSTMRPFLEELYALDPQSPRKALQLVFDRLDDALQEENFTFCDRMLEQAAPERLSVTAALGFLSATLGARDRLTKRESYARRLREVLQKSRPEDVNDLLKGLE
ncbi:MAG: DEAD/DEAH box helicase family protein [Polyangiaceae bacterium]|jgi:type III restriction enzyme|nr:DEAD/DEAH box helicase family protein [Polyangiaceae bacterium]